MLKGLLRRPNQASAFPLLRFKNIGFWVLNMYEGQNTLIYHWDSQSFTAISRSAIDDLHQLLRYIILLWCEMGEKNGIFAPYDKVEL